MAKAIRSVELVALPGIPLVRPGDDLTAVLMAAIDRLDEPLRDGDVLVVAQKIVSKAEGRYVDLAEISPSERARDLAAKVDKDPRLVEVILSESEEVLRYRPGVLVVVHKLGYVMANAGIDQSNVDRVPGAQPLLLLPKDPNETSRMLRERLEAAYGVRLGIVVNDTAGRAWRQGTLGLALGSAGLPALRDMIGEKDLSGRSLEVTQVAFADEIAAAASLVMGQAAEAQPAVLVRGLAWDDDGSDASALLRPKELDLFR